MSHDWPFMVITVRQLIHMRRRLRYTSFTKIISSSPACKVGYFRNLHREWQTPAATSCVSRVRECIPVHGYEICACYFPAVSETRKYVNILPLKINWSSPRYVLFSLCKVGVHLCRLKHFRTL